MEVSEVVCLESVSTRTSGFIASKSQHTATIFTELTPLIFQVKVLISVRGMGISMVGVRLRVGMLRDDGDVSENIFQAGQSSFASGEG